jgi:hypothetical protein
MVSSPIACLKWFGSYNWNFTTNRSVSPVIFFSLVIGSSDVHAAKMSRQHFRFSFSFIQYTFRKPFPLHLGEYDQ